MVTNVEAWQPPVPVHFDFMEESFSEIMLNIFGSVPWRNQSHKGLKWHKCE